MFLVVSSICATLLKQFQTKLTEEQTAQVKAAVQQAWQQLAYEGQKLGLMKESIDNQKNYWDKCIETANKQLEQQLEMFNRELKQQYIKMGVSAVTNIIGGAIGGTVVKGLINGGKQVLGGNNTYGGEVIFE